MSVYVVREFFDGCSDQGYAGVYDDFDLACASAMEQYEDDEPCRIEVEIFEDEGMIWFDNHEHYVTINKMEINEKQGGHNGTIT